MRKETKAHGLMSQASGRESGYKLGVSASAIFEILTLAVVSASLGQGAPAGTEPKAGESAVAQTAAIWTTEDIRLIDRPGEIVATLGNGLTVAVRENHDAPVAAVRFFVRAGSIYENPHLGAGLTHLCEHLLAGGATKKHSEEESNRLIQQMGGHHNAYTSQDHSCYFLTVPVQHVGTAVELVSDWLTHPEFPEEAFKREWGVVQRELEMNATDPDHQLYDQFMTLRYQESPRRYPVIGYQSVVQQLTHADIIAYYREHFVPDNGIFVVVGDFEAEKMFETLKKQFLDFERRPIRSQVLPDEPAMTGPREIVKVIPSMKGPAKVLVGFESVRLQHEDLYALDTLANVIGHGRSSRLYRILCEQKRLVLDIDASSDTPEWVNGTFYVTAEVSVENIGAFRQALSEQIEVLKKDGVTADELDRAKRQLQVEHVRGHQTVEQQASSMGRDFLSTGDVHFSDRYVENMQHVTADDIKRVAGKYLIANKQLTVIVRSPAAVGEAAAGAIPIGASIPIKKITLDNGLTVLLKSRPQTNLVNVRLMVRGGLIEEADANNGLTNLMGQTSLRGTKNYSAAQIDEYFDRVGGTLAAGCDNNSYYYAAEMMKEDFAKAFEIFGEAVLQPTFPDEELAKQKEQLIAEIQQMSNTWHYNGVRFFREKLFATSPYHRMWQGRVESVGSLTREQLAGYHDQSAVGSRAVLAIFGDIDMAATEAMVRKYFDAMPKGTALNLDQIAVDSAPSEAKLFVDKTAKNGAVVFVGYPGMKMTDIQRRYPMEIITEIIGSNTGWLHETLRGKQLVYYAWGFSFPGLLPGYVAATAQCQADKAPVVLEQIKQLLSKAAAGEFKDEEITLAKNNRINAEILQRQTSGEMAAVAASDELFGFGYNWSEGYADRIMAVTTEDIKKVASEFFGSPATVAIVTSQPESFDRQEAPAAKP